MIESATAKEEAMLIWLEDFGLPLDGVDAEVTLTQYDEKRKFSFKNLHHVEHGKAQVQSLRTVKEEQL